MTIRCTGRARKRLRLELTDAAGTDAGSTSLKEWYCNCAMLQRRPFFIVTHAQTLFSFWMPVAGHTNRRAFSLAMREHVRRALAEVGVDEASAAAVLDDGPDLFSRTSDVVWSDPWSTWPMCRRRSLLIEAGLHVSAWTS